MPSRAFCALLASLLFAISGFSQPRALLPLSTLLATELAKPVPPSVAFKDIVMLPQCCEPQLLGCEACIDQFYMAYFNALRPIVDHQFPNTEQYRESLTQAFIHMYATTAVWAGPGTYQIHEPARLAARLEWAIFDGERTHFRSASANHYSLQDVRASWLNTHGMPVTIEQSDEMQRNCSAGLRDLKRAFRHLSASAQQYYLSLAVNGFSDRLAF